ncbi:hypothetical protein ASPSYDRAFT_42774 [Aspergillus sydowii CBS 593.65]|uniref:Extracellular membrane protein CFEM domain-containing protein n=1 Tax=Aspergillus sydowii CBS 593.65 TaxID=1036612 RepID=A0A1L9TNB8_9EURO|nr:uncharacterized protein ASPSYDRAFT_42774 [Aspergillus sydowii CBS 593.65]OJJ60949.1 hypothetical protein ASPSYDRAFT_42774 [Aspergillus sydowii CBS 593.65]
MKLTILLLPLAVAAQTVDLQQRTQLLNHVQCLSDCSPTLKTLEGGDPSYLCNNLLQLDREFMECAGRCGVEGQLRKFSIHGSRLSGLSSILLKLFKKE